MNILNLAKKKAVITGLLEGNSIRSVSRMTGVHKTTILKLLKEVGTKCQSVLDTQMRQLKCSVIEADELWTFVGKKERRLSAEEKLNPELGDQYIFLGIDPQTKLTPVFTVGKRDSITTFRFISELKERLEGSTKLQITTDGFRPYIPAIEAVFGADVHFAMLNKVYAAVNPGAGRYSPPKVSGVEITTITGTPNRSRICTSYIERPNLTARMAIRRLTRLTTAFSRKLENLKSALALYLFNYNFCRIDGSLWVTPAMQAGLSTRIWAIDEII